MGIKSLAIGVFARQVARAITGSADHAINEQNKILQNLIYKGKNTDFGKDHNFNQVKTYSDFIAQVPIREYEDLRPYVDKIIQGRQHVLWPGKPKYFAKTSGTTSGVKYIPISNQSISYHIKTARNVIFNYESQNRKNLFDGKMIFLSGSPVLSDKNGIATGRLSGIVNHEIPRWIQSNKLPSYKTNCIEDWESKLDKIVEETYNLDMRLISGIPPWVIMYYERLLKKTRKKTIKEVFPNLSLFIHGGVNYSPYKTTIEALHGKGIDTLETYPASEGFIGFQTDINDPGLLLNTSAGMFYEFVLLSEIHLDNATRLTLDKVELDKDYVIIISSNAGLWAYNIGDTVRFISLAPYKIIVSGRIKHFISAFGEHVIAKEVEEAIDIVNKELGCKLNEFTIAPQVKPNNNQLPFHEWYIEFDKDSYDIEAIALRLDQELCRQNIYYNDLIQSRVLQPLKIINLPQGTFQDYMRTKGKLGGQNKVPRLTNDRIIVDELWPI